MADCFINNDDQQRCVCGIFVTHEHLEGNRVRFYCPRCGDREEQLCRNGHYADRLSEGDTIVRVNCDECDETQALWGDDLEPPESADADPTDLDSDSEHATAD